MFQILRCTNKGFKIRKIYLSKAILKLMHVCENLVIFLLSLNSKIHTFNVFILVILRSCVAPSLHWRLILNVVHLPPTPENYRKPSENLDKASPKARLKSINQAILEIVLLMWSFI